MTRKPAALLSLVPLLTVALGALSALGPAPARSSTEAPHAPIADTEEFPFAWLAGHWVGEGLGGTAEEIWAPPRAGVMAAMFRLIKAERTSFYELVTIQEGKEGWEMRLRHFHADLRGWEDKTGPLVWPCLENEKGRAVFGPVTYELQKDGSLVALVELEEGQDPARLHFHRAGEASTVRATSDTGR